MGDEDKVIDYSAQVQQHVDIADQFIKGKIQLDECLNQIFDIIPLGCKDTKVCEDNAAAVLSVLCNVKDVKPEVVEKLSSDQQDWLLMYVYKGLGASENKDATYIPASPQILFKWFSVVQSVAGDGCVMRAVLRRRAL
ncbi:hypothetical protein EIN_224260 [Entamoeba invadens IP1]|uniref:Actin-related protein 2/3 complex subunit 5 n=1 Tax=Entamoeba invadens IP1 TaxID=370355 RepID=A0A0A1U877_ENTIV|nr:hypothetical protein EIN_224260 [Entamoeba invadens IP1]ELP88183.1 hypothetical protein EIN_224260 [Entamoeba invadens IP1]|eukprot:XP_004254954.1 hypothetical protein EIN_224260 [Entamoeba invadens IP1]